LKIKSLSFALISSIVLLIVVIAPFIFSQKYQSWFLQHGVKGYTFSVLVALIISLIAALLFKGINQKIVVLACSLLFVGSHFVNRQSQVNALLDNSRWEYVQIALNTNKLKNFLTTSDVVYSPALWNHSWWLGFHEDQDYWSKYTEKFLNKVNFSKTRKYQGAISIFDFQNGPLIYAYKSDNVKNEIFIIIVVHPINMPIRLLARDNGEVVSGETQCNKEYCETIFPGVFKSKISLVTPDGRVLLKVF
jgi:hypothetical protein